MDNNTAVYQVKLKAGVLACYKGRVLLIKELNNRTRKYRWNIIKGTFEAEKDETILDTAVREATEEANAKIKLKHLLGIYYLLDEKNALMMFTFIASLLDPDIAISPKERQREFTEDEDIMEVKLFSKAELRKMKPRDFVGMRGYVAVQDYLKGKKYPLSILHNLK